MGLGCVAGGLQGSGGSPGVIGWHGGIGPRDKGSLAMQGEIGDQLFQQILQQPEDHHLRLVYADWCDQQGDARGEFIRLQLALHRPCENIKPTQPEGRSRSAASPTPWTNTEIDCPPSWQKVESGHDTSALTWRRREWELLTKNRRKWNAPLHRSLLGTPLVGGVGRRRPIRSWNYQRGFVEHLRVDGWAFLNHENVLFQLGPLTSVTLRTFPPTMLQRLTSPSRRFRTLRQATLIMHERCRRKDMAVLLKACRDEAAPRITLCGEGVSPFLETTLWSELAACDRITINGFDRATP